MVEFSSGLKGMALNLDARRVESGRQHSRNSNGNGNPENHTSSHGSPSWDPFEVPGVPRQFGHLVLCEVAGLSA